MNLNTKLPMETTDLVTKVNRVTIPEIQDNFEEHKRDHFIVFHDKGEDDTFNHKLLQTNSHISYYTKTVVPYSVLVGLSGNSRGEAVYSLQKQFSVKQIKNVYQASLLCTTVLDVPVVYPDIKPTQLLFSICDLRYLIRRAEVSFPALTKDEVKVNNRDKYYSKATDGLYYLDTKYKLEYFNEMHEFLARWVMRLYITCDTKEEQAEFEKLAIEKVNGK